LNWRRGDDVVGAAREVAFREGADGRVDVTQILVNDLELETGVEVSDEVGVDPSIVPTH
jgi:hypothetical protein